MAELNHKLKKYAAYLRSNPDGEKIVQVLRKLTSLPLTVNLLQETGIGKAVNGFRKCEGDKGAWAKDLITRWKLLVRESVKKQDSGEDEASHHSESQGSQSADEGSDRGEDEEEAGSGAEDSRASEANEAGSEAGSDNDGSAGEEDQDFSDQHHHSASEDEDSRSEKSSSSQVPSNASNREQEAESCDDSDMESPHRGRGLSKDHRNSAHGKHDKHRHHQSTSAGHQMKSTGDKNTKGSSGNNRHREHYEKSQHKGRSHLEHSEKHSGEKYEKHSREGHSSSEKHSSDKYKKHSSNKPDKIEKLSSDKHHADKLGKHSSDKHDKHHTGKHEKHTGDKHTHKLEKYSNEKHSSSVHKSDKHSSERLEKHSGDKHAGKHEKYSSDKHSSSVHRSDKYSNERHEKHSGDKYTDKHEKYSSEKHSGSINKCDKHSIERHEKHSREKQSDRSKAERHSSERHEKHTSGKYEKHAGDRLEEASWENHSGTEQSEQHYSSTDRRDKPENVSHEKHSSKKHGQTESSHKAQKGHSSHSTSSMHYPKANDPTRSEEKQHSKTPSQDKTSSHHSSSRHKDSKSKSSSHQVTSSEKGTEKHSKHSQGEKSSRDKHSSDRKGKKIIDSCVQGKSESHSGAKVKEYHPSAKNKSSSERDKTDSPHRSRRDNSDNTRKTHGERSLFDVFSDTKAKSKSPPRDKILGDTSNDDYEDYINKWIEDGITQQYNPGSVPSGQSCSLGNGMDDYEDLIDQEVDSGCTVEYTPGSAKMSTALRKQARFKDSSQSPDDYAEYIDKGVKQSGICADYKPGSKNPHKHSGLKVLHGDQSPEDYSEWIEQGVKEQCAVYQPSNPDKSGKDRSKSRKGASQSPDDYGDFIDRGVNESCVAEYNPSSVKREKHSEHKESVRKKDKSSRHSLSSSSKVRNTPVEVDIKTRQDGKSFQEPRENRLSEGKSRAGKESSSGSSAKGEVKTVGKKEGPQVERQSQVISSGGSDKAHKPTSVKKSVKRPAPVDSKALMEDSLFAAPDDFRIKVPAKKHHKPAVSKMSEKPQYSSSSNSPSSSALPSPSKHPSSKDAERGPTSHKSSEKSSSKSSSSSDKRLEADRGVEDSRHKGSKPSKPGSSTKREPSPDDAEDMTSFEDFLNYDESKAVKAKRKKVEKPQAGPASILGTYGLSAPKQAKLTEADIMAALPEPSINYRPRRLLPIDEDRHKEKNGYVDPMTIASKNTTRTQVYSGRRHGLTEVKSLFDCCVQVLVENIDSIDYVGGIPYDVLKPVVDRATAAQLYNLEDYNPQFLEDTDHLWKAHCQKEFRGCEPDEIETWRELYLRKHDEREAKYLKLRDNMSKSMTKGQAGRKVRLAFMDTVAKPPREVRRQQIRHGTAGVVRHGAATPSSSASQSSSLKHKGYVPMKPQGPPVQDDRHNRSTFVRRAPMMEKTLKMIKRIRH